MRVAVANQKGGVGKTTTAVNLLSSLAERGYRCLLVDLDPQANATTGLGIDHRDLPLSTYDVVIEGRSAADAIIETDQERLHLLPSAIDLAGAELELVPAMARESKLRSGLEGVADRYDVVLIDCPPSLGLLTVNALTAADQLLIPIQCEYYALEGLTQLLRNVELVRAGLNARLEIGAIVLTMYDARTKLSEQVADEVRQHFPDRVFSTVIPRSVRLSEAPSYGQPAVTYDPSSRGSMAYSWLAEEFQARILEPKGIRPASAPRAQPEPVTPAHRDAGPDAPAPSVEEAAPREAAATSREPQVSEETTVSATGTGRNHGAWSSPGSPLPPEEPEAQSGSSDDESSVPRGDPWAAPEPEQETEPPSDESDERTEGAPEEQAKSTESEQDKDDPWYHRGEREGW